MKRTVAVFLVGALILSLLLISSQNADAQSTTLTFTALGDYGVNNESAAAVASMVNGWNPDLILTLGDNYHGSTGGMGSETYDLSTGKYYCNFLKDINTSGTLCPTGLASMNRFFPTVGDHDYTDAGTSNDSLPSTYTDYFTLPGDGYVSSSDNERYYDFVAGPVHFFVLNGLEQLNFEPDGFDSTSIQAQWLKTQLGASTSIWNVVAVHKPPYSSGTKHGGAEHLHWPFAQWGADVVFSGHEHTYERIHRDGIVYFVNGLGGDWIYPFGTPIEGSAVRYNERNGAQRVVVTNTSMTIEFYSIENGGTLIDSYTITAPHKTATPTLPLVETGWQSPSRQAASGSNGDRNGYEVNPTYTYADDGLAALDTDSGISPVLDCTDSGKDKHRFLDYNVPIPDGALVQGLQVRLDANADSTDGTPQLCVSLSWDGGLTWSPWKTSPTLTNSEKSYFMGGASDTWGYIWTSADLSNTNFQVRVANITTDNERDFSLDWIAVNITYSLVPVTLTSTPTLTESPTYTPTASQTETLTDTATPSSTATVSETVTHSPTATFTDTPTPSPTISQTATSLDSNTETQTPTQTLTPTYTSTSTPTATQTETLTATATPSFSATVSQTALPTVMPFKAVGAQDGWVLESSETSNQGGVIDTTAATFNLGDTSSRQQYRAILSFNTSSLPDNAVITGLTLKIKKHSVAGMNPFTMHLKIAVDLRKGAFSTTSALQPTDFQAAASKPSVGLIANNPQAGGWYLSKLTSAAYPYVNRTGITQFRLRFQTDDDNDPVADFIRFYSGNSTAPNQPILVIEYYVP